MPPSMVLLFHEQQRFRRARGGAIGKVDLLRLHPRWRSSNGNVFRGGRGDGGHWQSLKKPDARTAGTREENRKCAGFQSSRSRNYRQVSREEHFVSTGA